jgi:uncharacterized protein DUF1835
LLPLPDTTVATRNRMVRKYKLSEFPDPVQFLHIRCGDDILGTLDRAGIAGDKIRFSEVLSEGPLRYPADDARRQKERASYLAARYFVPMTETYREIVGQDWRVTQCVRYDEAVLWFEADLFDQAILVYLLQRLAPLQQETRVSLICIGEFPGVERFIGLGQLTPEQLALLLPTRQRVTRRQFALARETWVALTHRHPRELNRISRMRTRALPFLPAALRRFLAEYPSTANGLSQTEQLALEAIASGARTPGQAFVAVQAREPRPFMGDAMFYAVLRDLASGDFPALAGSRRNLPRLADAELRDCELWLTPLGQRVLANKADWFRLSETARWMGGVLVRGPKPRWRWDRKRGRLVEQRGRPRTLLKPAKPRRRKPRPTRARRHRR